MTASPENSLRGKLYERKRRLLNHCHTALGEDWPSLPDEEKRARVMEKALEHDYFREGGFWKEVFKGGGGVLAETGYTHAKLAQAVNHTMRETANPVTERQMFGFFNNGRRLSDTLRRVFDFLSDGRLTKQDIELLGHMPVARDLRKKAPFIEGLDALMGQDISNVDILRKAYLDPRMGRIRVVSRAAMAGLREGVVYKAAWQTLHGIMIGLENSGIARAQLAEFAREFSIPYDSDTGRVLPSIHEVLRDLYKEGKKPLPSTLLFAMRTAHDIDLGQQTCAERLNQPLSSYISYEQPTEKWYPVLDRIQTERLLDLFDSMLAEDKKLTSQERRIVVDIMEIGYPAHVSLTDRKNNNGWISLSYGRSPDDTRLRKRNPHRPAKMGNSAPTGAAPIP